MFRTRFKKEIVAEFLPPARALKKQRVILLCDGMPSIPRKQPLAQFLSKKGYWVFYPRWRGAWESDGRFLERPPQQDLSDIIEELPKGVRESAFGQRFKLSPDEIFVIGGSFGGAAAILASLDPRVNKVIANCPVVDWSILSEEQKKETSNKSYVAYIREAFGNGYRLSEKNWNKLHTGTFYNPIHHINELTPAKILMFHAKDDPYIPWKSVSSFASSAGIKLRLLARGGHVRTEYIVETYWPQIKRFFDSAFKGRN
ncbi:MAG TPA: prolyl oligopeptidase family serine peptidase [Candidatus Angelobacter sp.]|jgi:predicted alpha/beta hydrolase|nr:prolyl oligopeptidase family serine peptidase [Candidatus Angelobacter sp.]